MAVINHRFRRIRPLQLRHIRCPHSQTLVCCDDRNSTFTYQVLLCTQGMPLHSSTSVSLHQQANLTIDSECSCSCGMACGCDIIEDLSRQGAAGRRPPGQWRPRCRPPSCPGAPAGSLASAMRTRPPRCLRASHRAPPRGSAAVLQSRSEGSATSYLASAKSHIGTPRVQAHARLSPFRADAHVGRRSGLIWHDDCETDPDSENAVDSGQQPELKPCTLRLDAAGARVLGLMRCLVRAPSYTS